MPGSDSFSGWFVVGKAAVFIDGGYLDPVLDFHDRIRIDYERFTDPICKPNDRTTASGWPRMNESQSCWIS